ncbi:MAG: helix-turn-helix domain-containing protein [Taibaiella sp.]|nr:helix-turn-helix domain-containing protein [Taibaiella sp.]
MVLREFPDLSLVRKLRGTATTGEHVWQNVVLNFECREASRLDLESPYSLFINKKGYSLCSVNGREYRVETDQVLFSQPGDVYGLTIDNINKTEICNIHISRHFFEQVAFSAMNSDANLLDKHDGAMDTRHLNSQFYENSMRLQHLVDRLTTEPAIAGDNYDILMADIVKVMLGYNQEVAKKIADLPFARAAVRNDIYRRLTIARDFLHSNYYRTPDLNEISREVAMSKFHFLRAFRNHFGMAPHQYLARVKMEKASMLLKKGQLTIYQVADSVGFEEPNAFIRAFGRTYGISPQKYRKREMSNQG